MPAPAASRAFGRPVALRASLWLAAWGLTCGILAQAADPPGKSVAEYARDLASSDRDVKREAAYQLSRPGVNAREALPQLIEALGDGQQQVWFGAVTAIANLGPAAEPALPALWKELEAWEPFRRERQGMQSLLRTASALGAIGAAAVPHLTNGLVHSKWSVRAGSALALGFTGELALPALPALVGLLDDSRAEVRDAVIETLVGLRAPAAVAVQQVLERSGSAALRQRAAGALGQMGASAEAALPQLRRLAVEDPEVEVRAAALGAVSRLHRNGPETVAMLLTNWRRGPEALEKAAARELSLLRPPPEALWEALRTDLAGGSEEARIRAANLVAQLGRTAAPLVESVVPAFGGRRGATLPAPTREALLGAMAGVGVPALPAIWESLSALSPNDLDTNDWAVAVLRRMDPTASAALAAALAHATPAIRAAALEGLEAMGEGARLRAKAIAPLISDPEPAVRSRAWTAASRCGVDPEVLSKALPTALQDPSAAVRRAAVAGISRLGRGAVPAVPFLIQELDSKDEQARDAAIDAIAALGVDAATATERLSELVANGPARTRDKALLALGGIGPAAGAAADEIEACVKSADAGLRRLALEALGRLKEASKPVLATVMGAAADSEAVVRGAALLAMVQIDPAAEEIITRVVSGLEDSDAGVRRAAAEAVAKAGEKGRPAEARLFAMLADPAQRSMAREALRSIQPTSVTNLVGALGNEEWTVRQMAADALARLGKQAEAAVDLLEKLAREDSYEDVKRACRRAIRRIREG